MFTCIYFNIFQKPLYHQKKKSAVSNNGDESKQSADVLVSEVEALKNADETKQTCDILVADVVVSNNPDESKQSLDILVADVVVSNNPDESKQSLNILVADVVVSNNPDESKQYLDILVADVVVSNNPDESKQSLDILVADVVVSNNPDETKQSVNIADETKQLVTDAAKTPGAADMSSVQANHGYDIMLPVFSNALSGTSIYQALCLVCVTCSFQHVQKSVLPIIVAGFFSILVLKNVKISKKSSVF